MLIIIFLRQLIAEIPVALPFQKMRTAYVYWGYQHGLLSLEILPTRELFRISITLLGLVRIRQIITLIWALKIA